MVFKKWLVGLMMLVMIFIAGCSQNAQMANPASVYCREEGGKLDIRFDNDGGQYGVCLFDDGSQCEEWEFFRGECAIGDSLISSFDECAAAGYPVMESFPRKCSVGDSVFVEVVDDNEAPGVCTLEYLPVCGSDGKTYSNDCFSSNAGVEIAYEGVCGEENAFAEPRICTREYNPVCGADGVTYSNPCMAGLMGIEYTGECGELREAQLGCEEQGGLWLDEFSECEGLSENQCNEIGGDYDSCASACRNDPDADICTLQCVQICRFD